MPRKAGYIHNDETRAKIQASALINRLHNHVVSKKPIMDNSQVNAAKALLNKVLPDLATTTIVGDANAPLRHVIERRIIDPSK